MVSVLVVDQSFTLAEEVMGVCLSSLHVLYVPGEGLGPCSLRHSVGSTVMDIGANDPHGPERKRRVKIMDG